MLSCGKIPRTLDVPFALEKHNHAIVLVVVSFSSSDCLPPQFQVEYDYEDRCAEDEDDFLRAA